MDLETRLKTLATGVNVSDAIESYLEELRTSTTGVEMDTAAETRAESEAIVEIMFLMAAVDGNVSPEELEQVRASVAALEDMGSLGRVDANAILKEMTERLERDGWSARLRAACAKLRAPDARSFAFRLAAGVAFVDDLVAHAEAAAIDSLAAELGIGKDESQQILVDVQETLFG
jgi:hypothetical protein